MAMSFRLDPLTEAHIRRVARATGRSKSAVVRDAMAQYMAGQVAEARFHQSTLERLRGFVGVISSEGQFSTDTHGKYRDALTRKYRGRGSR